MGLFDFLKGAFSSGDFQVDYASFDDSRLLELWETRSTLTPSARGALSKELVGRGLVAQEEATPEPDSEPAPPPEINAFAAYQVDVAGERIALNAPVIEEQDGELCRDPLEVARIVAEELGGRRPAAGADPLFVEAVWLLTRAGQPLPELGNDARRGLAEVTRAAFAGDADAAFDELKRFSARDADWLGWHTDSLLGARWPDRQERWCRSNGQDPGLITIEALALADPGAAAAAIEIVEDPSWHPALLGEALIAAFDGGHRDGPLAVAWAAHGKGAWGRKDIGWVTTEIRRLARVDLEEAEGLLHDADDEALLTPIASEAFFSRLAPVEPERALDLAADPEYGVDALPRLRGCHLGGLEVADRLDRFYDEQLTFDAHQPNAVFRYLMELAIDRGDSAALVRAIEVGGPHAWQVVAAAADPLRDAIGRGSEQVPELLEACLTKRSAGAVAGRDASAGQPVVGHVEFKPGWLTFDRPHVLEALVLQAALDAAAPTWRPARSPLP